MGQMGAICSLSLIQCLQVQAQDDICSQLVRCTVGSLSATILVFGWVSQMSRLRQLMRHVSLFAWLESWYKNVFHALQDLADFTR